MLNRRSGTAFSLFFALAALAAALALLRPACELWIAHAGAVGEPSQVISLVAQGGHHSDADVQCCATITDPNAATPLQAGIGGLELPQLPVAAPFVGFVSGTVFLARELNALRAPPRNIPSFYLRSARILR